MGEGFLRIAILPAPLDGLVGAEGDLDEGVGGEGGVMSLEEGPEFTCHPEIFVHYDWIRISLGINESQFLAAVSAGWGPPLLFFSTWM